MVISYAEIKQKATLLEPLLLKWRRELHAIPEAGVVLHQTSRYLGNVLSEMGLSFQTGFAGGYGIVASLPGRLETRAELHQRLNEIGEGVGRQYGAGFHLKIKEGYPPVCNQPS